MKYSYAVRYFCGVLFAFAFTLTGFGQKLPAATNPKYDTVRIGDTAFYYRNDTLLTNKGFSVYRGQHLLVGKGSGQNGWYRCIGFKSPLAFPLLFLYNEEVNHQYQGDAETRNKDKLRDFLTPGQTLIVTSIKQFRSKSKFPYYVLGLADGTSTLSNKYVSEIISAFWTKELSVGLNSS